MTTLLCRLQKRRFTRFLPYFRNVGTSHIVTKRTLDFANSTLGFARAFGGGGVGGRGVGGWHDDVQATSPTPHTTSKTSPPMLRSAFRVLASPSHVQLASLFLMFRRCCAPGFGSV